MPAFSFKQVGWPTISGSIKYIKDSKAKSWPPDQEEEKKILATLEYSYNRFIQLLDESEQAGLSLKKTKHLNKRGKGKAYLSGIKGSNKLRVIFLHYSEHMRTQSNHTKAKFLHSPSY